jgi:competence protein ComEC
MFVIMTGAEASIIRATLMACIGLGATLFGREYIAKQALILSLLVIILYDPYLLLHDVSLHLSFLATAGIIYIREPCKNLLQKIIKNFSFFTETFATTCAAYLATLPYIMHTFGSVSVYALFSNMLVVPLVPFSMLLTCVVVVASYISQPLAFLVGYADTLLIKVMLIVAESVKRLPYASYSIELSVTGMCGAYIFEFLSIAFIFMKLGKKFQIKKSFVKNLKEDETLLTKDSEILSEIISY